MPKGIGYGKTGGGNSIKVKKGSKKTPKTGGRRR